MSNMILVGPMGAGKSTIGRLLAKELHLVFKDSDKEIEQRCGANIPWIFDVEGELGFREREQAMIAELCSESGLVIATGGGAVLREANRVALKGGGRVIYLHASVEQQIARTARDKGRPLLQKPNPGQVLRDLMEVRDPLYREIADVVVETDERPPRMVVQEILERLRRLERH
ncbi:shikimate kinase AroK [Pseudomonas sp. Milli4]|uniref:Shikimate kinase n=1 Tax=Pseudomonas schmalbachii TaxID=2816993 RepID=A0ABS3TWZ1_9PSED|nr:shikimate kinase AroK [Pseudomonas schmalbachii]MBO3278182.1 shikimate kinase AroK [Pseudomonas schmalbachii]